MRFNEKWFKKLYEGENSFEGEPDNEDSLYHRGLCSCRRGRTHNDALNHALQHVFGIRKCDIKLQEYFLCNIA